VVLEPVGAHAVQTFEVAGVHHASLRRGRQVPARCDRLCRLLATRTALAATDPSHVRRHGRFAGHEQFVEIGLSEYGKNSEIGIHLGKLTRNITVNVAH
jgi:hypothetical protein